MNVILDEGAWRSFITQDLADCLRLNSDCVVIAAFGASEDSNQTLPVATIHLQFTDGTEIPVSILVSPKIAQLLRNLPFFYVKQLLYLEDLQLNHKISGNWIIPWGHGP